MDQLKPILIGIKTHRFWVTCGVTLVACIAAWYLGTSSLATQTDENATAINGSKSTVDGIQEQPVVEGVDGAPSAYPNTDVQEGMTELINKGRLVMKDAWDTQYQKQRSLFVWPEKLPEEVRNAFQPLRPIESALPFPTPREKEVNNRYLLAYRDYIEERLPQLAQKIGAHWSAKGAASTGGSPYDGGSSSGGSGRGGSNDGLAGAATENKEPEVVQWDVKNQKLWENKTTIFTGKNGNNSETNTPLTIQVMYAQEDLWILEAIFDVIKATNGEADAADLADIKVIDHIFVGIDASGRVGDVTKMADSDSRSSLGGSGGSPYGSGGSPYGSGSSAGGSPYGNSGKPGAAAAAPDPANYRYVDSNYKPIDAATLRAAFTTRTPENAALAVAKRVPIRLGLQMDERAIFEFLANCGNSQPTIEIRQVRINRHDAGDLGKDPAPGAGSEGNSPYGGSGGGGNSNEGLGGAGSGAPAGGGGSPGGAPGGYGGDQGGSKTDMGSTDYVVDVEVYGIVHIFNPVDPERVKVEGGQGGGPLQGQPVTMNQQPAISEQ